MASVEHLRPWMAWAATEPRPLAERRDLLVAGERSWEAGTDFVFGLFDVDDPRTVVGGCGLHARVGPAALEIGYWVRAGHTGRGHATAASSALVDAAFGLAGIERVELHHDEANLASARVPEKLGFRLVRKVPDEIVAPAEVGISWEWVLERPTVPSPGA